MSAEWLFIVLMIMCIEFSIVMIAMSIRKFFTVLGLSIKRIGWSILCFGGLKDKISRGLTRIGKSKEQIDDFIMDGKMRVNTVKSNVNAVKSVYNFARNIVWFIIALFSIQIIMFIYLIIKSL